MKENFIQKIYEDNDPDVQIVKAFKNTTFWTLNDFAKFFNISKKTAWEMVRKGDIKAVKIKGEWRIHYLTIVEYIKEKNSYYLD